MRIMLVVNEFPPEKIAGTAMATQALAEQLTQRGHQVSVVVTTECPPEKRQDIKAHDYALIWLPIRPLRGMGILWRIWQLYRVARRLRPGLIQGQAVSCGFLAAVVGRWLNIPSICYAQGYDVYQASRLQRFTEIRWGCACPSRLLAVTRHLAATIEQTVGIKPDMVLPHAFLMPKQVLSRCDARVKLDIEQDEILIFCVGRLADFKGHDVLLAAMPEVLQHKANAKLWIAGIGAEAQALQAQAKELGISGSVQLVGYRTPEEIHGMMAAADLFVLPSRSEPFGIVLLEAMAHDVPVVATRVGGIPEVVCDASSLVEADDVKALAQMMIKHIAIPFVPAKDNQMHAMGFEWSRQVVRFESIYKKLIDDHASTQSKT